MSSVRLRRLQADYDKLKAFLAQQPRVRLIQAQGTPPERYQLEYQIKGLREVDDQLQTVANHIVEIALPLSYPRLPPQCRMLTPVFHPNIAPHAICIGDHWSAGEPLWSMVARIGEMIAYQSYNTKSPLNGEAARWVEANQQQLPLDRTNFVLDEAPGATGDFSPVAAPQAAPQTVLPPVNRTDAALPAAGPVLPPIARPELPTSRPAAAPMALPPGLAATIAFPPSVPPSSPAPAASVPTPAVASPPDDGYSSPTAPQAAVAVPANIIIECGKCRARYSLSPTAAGKRVRCKKCQAILLVPTP
jgi:LSD1 subclass zinc finger protein